MLDLVIVTGMSGSGKSVALHALEDVGYYCVDNLPPELLAPLVMLEKNRLQVTRVRKLAVAMDARSASSLPALVPTLDALGTLSVQVRTLFLDADTDSLVRRFSESRRPHPLARMSEDDSPSVLLDTIDAERELLAPLKERSAVIDTSFLKPMQLRAWVWQMVEAQSQALTLVFESFAYKHGVPMYADFVFNARMLPNPHYVKELRPLTGRDGPIIEFMQAQPEAAELINEIYSFLKRWLPGLQSDQRSNITVAIGCTGGQHRSVYLVEQLAARFAAEDAVVIKRHREQDAR